MPHVYKSTDFTRVLCSLNLIRCFILLPFIHRSVSLCIHVRKNVVDSCFLEFLACMLVSLRRVPSLYFLSANARLCFVEELCIFFSCIKPNAEGEEAGTFMQVYICLVFLDFIGVLEA